VTVVGEERMLSYEGWFTSGARSLRVVEVLEAGERGATRGDRAA
jgi:hypothetical protein